MAIVLNFISTKVEYESEITAFCSDYSMNSSTFELKTSGSTGIPKTVVFSRDKLQNSALATIKKLNLTNNYKALICLNTNYIAGKMMLVRCIEASMNAYVVEPSSFPFENLEDSIEIDFAAFVPFQLIQLFERNNPRDLFILNRIKKILVGGEKINDWLVEKLKELKSEVYHTFGMTETVSHFALKNISKSDSHFEILEGVAISTNEANCLKVKSFATNFEWLQTNDIVELIYDKSKVIGFNWIGRIDNVINSGGIKINVEVLESEIEKTFRKLGFNYQFFVYKKDDAKYNEKVVLLIEGHNKNQEFRKTILDELSKTVENKYWVPKEIYFLEKFCLTNSGKLDRIKTSKLIQ